MITLDMRDAIALRKAAEILERRAIDPRRLFLRATCKALRNIAEDVEIGKAPVKR